MDLLTVCLITYLLNIPFGHWRAHVPKLSRNWFLSVHFPVLIVIALRFVSGLGWALITFPALVGAFFLGQLSGGKVYSVLKHRAKVRTSPCLFRDIVRWEPLEQ